MYQRFAPGTGGGGGGVVGGKGEGGVSTEIWHFQVFKWAQLEWTDA